MLEDPARDTWQRPDDVVRALKCKPTMTVAEVGAGTGYFAVRLAREVPLGEVIATDLARENVQALRERARREGLANLRVVRATKRASGLSAESVDRVLVAHVWHHMTDHDACVRDLVAAMRPGARLVVLEFHPGAHRGPPASLRVAPAEVIAVLKRAGLSAKVSPVEITDQYLVEARRRVPNARS
ncbi:MAG: class I SAM-dependent methyltransferase [Deltaproteobacteria bacterium]|nr:class I SAM-dependent methyltransferase [Deltaproteobacteria bacterium]